MQDSEEWLDEMHIRLYEVFKTNNWNFIQRSSVPVGTRSFVLFHGSKRLRIEITSEAATTTNADIMFNRDSANLTGDQIRVIISQKLRE